jgi:hypothetical protein
MLPQGANHTGLADSVMNFAAEFGKLAGDELGRAVLCSDKAKRPLGSQSIIGEFSKHRHASVMTGTWRRPAPD